MQVSGVCVSGRADQADSSTSPGPSEAESVNPTCHADCLPNPVLRKETSLKESQELATSVLPEEGLPSAIDNHGPPASVAVRNSPSSHTAGEQDPSIHEKLLEPVSDARGGEILPDGTLQLASQLHQHPHAGPTAVLGDSQAAESTTGVVQGDDQQLTGLVSELMTADSLLGIVTGEYCHRKEQLALLNRRW